MLILAIDPGITTGFAIARIDLSDKVYVCCGEALFNHREFWNLLQDLEPQQMVCESFEYRNMKRDNLELFSREIIGITKLYESFGHGLKMQTAAQGKSITDERLRRMGLYEKGKKHGRDAMRHFVYWFVSGSGYQFNKKQRIFLTTERIVRYGP